MAREPLRLRLPADYKGVDDFSVLEWLDDDHVALMATPTSGGSTTARTVEPRGTGGILVCRVSTGGCELAVPAKNKAAGR